MTTNNKAVEWRFKCCNCNEDFQWWTHAHIPGDGTGGGPPPGCPACGSLSFEALVSPGDKKQ